MNIGIPGSGAVAKALGSGEAIVLAVKGDAAATCMDKSR